VIRKSQEELALTTAVGRSKRSELPSLVIIYFWGVSPCWLNDLNTISQGIGLVFSMLILNLLEVFIFIKPKSTTGSIILRVGPLKEPLHWKLMGAPSWTSI
jgi:hypothetical protein